MPSKNKKKPKDRLRVANISKVSAKIWIGKDYPTTRLYYFFNERTHSSRRTSPTWPQDRSNDASKLPVFSESSAKLQTLCSVRLLKLYLVRLISGCFSVMQAPPLSIEKSSWLRISPLSMPSSLTDIEMISGAVWLQIAILRRKCLSLWLCFGLVVSHYSKQS